MTNSKKLKKYWKKVSEKRKIQQRKIMIKNLTKWIYIIDKRPCCHATVVDLGLKNCLKSFHRKKTNKIKFKGFKIERRLISGKDKSQRRVLLSRID